MVEAALKDLRRRLSGELVPFENAALAVETIVKIRVEQSIGAYLGEEHPGEKISVQYRAEEGCLMNSAVGDRADPYFVHFNPNKPASDSRSRKPSREIAQLESKQANATMERRHDEQTKNRAPALWGPKSRLNEIAGIEGEAFTDEIRNEAARDSGGIRRSGSPSPGRDHSCGGRRRSADASVNFGNDDAEGEMRSALSWETVSIADYLTPASAGSGIEGRARELNAALKVEATGKSGGVAVPWAVLAGPTPAPEKRSADETRAFTTTGNYGGGVAQRPILQRLFGPGILDALGVRVDSVPSGRTEWPLITGGVAPAQAVENVAAADAVAATFSTETLKPKRLTGKYEFTHEQSAQVPDIEQALRRDLADAVKAKMSDLALNGDESTNPQEPDGFYLKLTAPMNPPAVATYDVYGGAHALAVDGIHAQNEMEVSSVIGVESYQHAAAVYQAGSGESGSQALAKRSMMCMASSYVPAAPTSGADEGVQKGNIFHAAGPNGGGPDMRADSVAAVWPTLEIIRDPYLRQASVGVVLTWVTLLGHGSGLPLGSLSADRFQGGLNGNAGFSRNRHATRIASRPVTGGR